MPRDKDGLLLWPIMTLEFFRKLNVEADALSRIPRTSGILIDVPAVKAIISAVPYTDHTDYNYNPSNIVC